MPDSFDELIDNLILEGTLLPEPVWKLEDGITLCRSIEKVLWPIGYHCGLTGSCLQKGESLKDLDVIIYPRKSTNLKSADEILNAIKEVGIECETLLYHEKYGDGKIVYKCFLENKAIDVFLLK